FLFEKGTGQRQVRWPCYLNVALGPANDRNRMVHPFNEARFIRSVILILPRAFEGFLQDLGSKNLRRLRQHEMFARERLTDEFFFGMLDRVDKWNAENRCSALVRLPDDAFDFGKSYEWPNRIVHRNQSGFWLKMLESSGNGILTTFSSADHLHGFLKTGTR